MPMACCDRRYTDDAHYVGGLLARANFQWGVLFKVVMAGAPDPEIVGPAWRDMWKARLEATPPILATWLRHQTEDAYWRRASTHVDYGAINIPAYFVSGWSDAYAHPVLRLLEEAQAPAKTLVGPWGHTYPYTAQPLGLDWAREEVRWWRHWLSGEATGIMNEPRLQAFMPYQTAREAGAERIPGRWISERSWPRRGAAHRLFLNPGVLGDKAAPGPAIRVRDAGIVGTATPEWIDLLPVEQTHDDLLSTSFDSAPLAAAEEILGSPSLSMRVTADKPVAAIVARLCEVRPDGTSWLVTWGALNLTHRDSHVSPQPLEPGKTYPVALELRAIAHRFSAGSRIRLSLSTGLWPMLWPSPEQAELSIEPGTSFLDLSVRPIDAGVAPPVPEIVTQAEAPPGYLPASAGADGRIILKTERPLFSYPVSSPGTLVSSGREETCDILASDFSSSHWRQRVRSGWKRGDWNCAVEASCDLSCRDGVFLIEETLTAFENDQQVGAWSSSARIPRNLA
jgi:predicted acyl esterase